MTYNSLQLHTGIFLSEEISAKGKYSQKKLDKAMDEVSKHNIYHYNVVPLERQATPAAKEETIMTSTMIRNAHVLIFHGTKTQHHFHIGSSVL
jgi:hypothetical protein